MPKLKHIKHVFFDLDHTLWDFDANSKSTYQYIFNAHNIDIDIDIFLQVYEPINQAYWKLYRENKINKKDLKKARLHDAFKVLDYSISDELLLQLADDYLLQLSNYTKLFDGAIDLLEYLKPRYKLYIITNGFNEIQSAKLHNSNITSYFEQVFTSENAQAKKPNPKVFFKALDTVNAKTYESIMIGDNIEADIFGAKNVGLKTIFCNFRNEIKPKNTITITKLAQIKDYL